MDDLVRLLRDAQYRVTNTKKALEASGLLTTPDVDAIAADGQTTQDIRSDIYNALLNISEPLASKYAQVKLDVGDDDRLSWSGSAHEIREVLRTLLELLAPDEDVTSQHWYTQEKDTSGPTHKQRVRYVLRARGAGSKERKVAESVELLDDRIASLVRDTYTRASDAAHGTKDRTEVRRLVRYFEAFAHDLLNLD